MDRLILHSDFNNFYASVEALSDPALKTKPVAVVGDAEARHGIVLAKNELAKRFNVKTGDVIWQARQKCPHITLVPAHFEKYLEYAALAREVYLSFTDRIEPFGLDESWLDMTRFSHDYKEAAERVRKTMKKELGLTVSVGASFNKVFAKLGSDMKKPDASTVITREDYRDKAWRLPVSDLLYVGRATTKKLNAVGIRTIGDLAGADMRMLYRMLGKIGVMLWQFANGLDSSSVTHCDYMPPVKSIGNSTTTVRDLITDDDIKVTLLSLCESVAARLRAQRSLCRVVRVGIRDSGLSWVERQRAVPPTDGTLTIFEAAHALLREHHDGAPLRSLSVSAASLTPSDGHVQMSLFPDEVKAQKRRALDGVMDGIRGKYGHEAIQFGVSMLKPELAFSPQASASIHPPAFLNRL